MSCTINVLDFGEMLVTKGFLIEKYFFKRDKEREKKYRIVRSGKIVEYFRWEFGIKQSVGVRADSSCKS